MSEDIWQTFLRECRALNISSRLCSFGEFCNRAVGARTVCLEGLACKLVEPLSRDSVSDRVPALVRGVVAVVLVSGNPIGVC